MMVIGADIPKSLTAGPNCHTIRWSIKSKPMSDLLQKKAVSSQAAPATKRRPRAERDRLNFRLDARIKQRAEDAALLLGQDLSTFAESALDEKAQAVLEREEKIVLSERDFERFLDAIDNPQPPTEKLREAMKQFQAISRDHPELNW